MDTAKLDRVRGPTGKLAVTAPDPMVIWSTVPPERRAKRLRPDGSTAMATVSSGTGTDTEVLSVCGVDQGDAGRAVVAVEDVEGGAVGTGKDVLDRRTDGNGGHAGRRRRRSGARARRCARSPTPTPTTPDEDWLIEWAPDVSGMIWPIEPVVRLSCWRLAEPFDLARSHMNPLGWGWPPSTSPAGPG